MSEDVREIAQMLAEHVRLWRETGAVGVPAAPSRGHSAALPEVELSRTVTTPTTARSPERTTLPSMPEVPRIASTPAAATVPRPEAHLARDSGRGLPEEALLPPALVGSPEGARPPADLDSLEALRGWLGDCQRCGLCRERTKIVFGVGHAQARIVLVGEAPGRDEDMEGEPFVGAAGRLLTDILQKGMKLQRGDVYICNVVKCRPPQNRNPEPDEIAACSPVLHAQLRLVRPEVILTLGKFAAQTLLGSSTPITQLRGHWQEWEGIPVMPTFHPAHLLRNPALKREVWEDVKQVMTRLGMRG